MHDWTWILVVIGAIAIVVAIASIIYRVKRKGPEQITTATTIGDSNTTRRCATVARREGSNLFQTH